ncbi:MAG: hypothetical protein Q9M50_12215 [Methylococcales bacterium]|nr:hypothetical protein [Methylococcales bacterium]
MKIKDFFFLTPSATNIKLTGHQFNYIFRTIPNNDQMGISIAHYLAEQGLSKIALLNSRSPYATELSDVFSSHLMKNKNASIPFRKSFFENTVNITSLAIDLKKIAEMDAIFIASTDIFAAKIYQKTRDMGIRLPFVAGDTLNMPPFLNMVKVWENSDDVKKNHCSIPI